VSDYPEHGKLQAIQRESQAIGEFVDWLGTQGIMLGHHVQFEDYGTGRTFVPWGGDLQDLLAQHFEIDRDKLEAEKRAMLAMIRGANGE
jgi:hypothetical protein